MVCLVIYKFKRGIFGLGMYHSHSRACLQWWRMAKTHWGTTSNHKHTLKKIKRWWTYVEEQCEMANIHWGTMWDGRHILKNNGTMLKNNEMTLGNDKNTNQIWRKQKFKGDIRKHMVRRLYWMQGFFFSFFPNV